MDWVLEGRAWNEQYLVQAFLAGNRLYRPRLAMTMLSMEAPDETGNFLFDDRTGGSLWIEKVATA